jgi:hypothetical protein
MIETIREVSGMKSTPETRLNVPVESHVQGSTHPRMCSLSRKNRSSLSIRRFSNRSFVEISGRSVSSPIA